MLQNELLQKFGKRFFMFLFCYRNHEEGIRLYEGDDPLEKWYEFIIFLEQSNPKGSNETPAMVIRNCLSLFENDPRYQQDRRFIRLWIKFVSVLLRFYY